MSVYVTSDLHGLELAQLKNLLQKAGFGSGDWLYILGDVVDRNGDGGVEILCWLLEQPNAQLILGNHEAMLLSCTFVFDHITNDSIQEITAEKIGLLNNYMQNGGDVTLKTMRQLHDKSPQAVQDILEYLREAPLYEAITAGGRDFLLVHAGIDDFDKTKKMSQYSADDFLWVSPELGTGYFDDIITVFGHTPTMCYGKEFTGKILKTRTWIDIDVGAGFGQKAALLRLDDLKEFYAVD